MIKDKRILSKGLIKKNLKKGQKFLEQTLILLIIKIFILFEIGKILKRKLRKNIQAGMMLKLRILIKYVRCYGYVGRSILPKSIIQNALKLMENRGPDNQVCREKFNQKFFLSSRLKIVDELSDLINQ